MHQNLQAYRALIRRRIALLIVLAVAALAALCLDLATGPSSLSVVDAFRALVFPSSANETALLIVRTVRLPAATMAILSGAALALAGAEMQTALNNPLASPFTLGVSSGAVFGAALAIVAGISIPHIAPDWTVSANAFLFAVIAVTVLQALARLRGAGPETLVLFGTALFFTFNALVAILQYVAGEQALQQLVFWTMGSLGRANWARVQLLAIALAVIAPFSFSASWRLTALRLGDERAQSFGVDVVALRRFSLLRISVLTAAAVAFVGTIPFVGLVGPHIARLLVGEDHRFFLPASALSGAIVMSLASVASKKVIPGATIPIGLVAALIGVPFFLTLIITARRT